MVTGSIGSPQRPRGRLRFGDLEVDVESARLFRAGSPVHLEPRSFHLLLFLVERPQRLVTKRELLEQVWGGAFVTDNALDRAVARLRRALGDTAREPRFIETAPGMGYRFLPVVEIVQEEASADGPGTGPEEPPPARVSRSATDRGGPFSRRRLALAGAGALAAVVLAIVLRAGDPTGPRAVPVPAPASSGVTPRQLTSSQDYEHSPTFSPDGSAIAYTSNAAGKSAIWVRSLASGGQALELTPEGARRAAWSPDGRWIAYDSYQGIWVVPPTGGAPRQLTERGAAPAWSPDSARLAFQLLGEGLDINSFAATPPSTLWTVELAGGPPRRLTDADRPPGGHGQPAFSPDGDRIAFVTAGGGSRGELWTIAADGSDPRRVLGPCGCRDPVFARDGRSLYYTDAVEAIPALWQVPLDEQGGTGGTARRLYEGPLRFLAASADGRLLAASRHELRSDLWVLPVARQTGDAAADAAPLTRETNYRNMYPVASPDGRRIAFMVARAGNPTELWSLDSGSGGRTLLAATSAAIGGIGAAGSGGWPAWSADSHHLFYVDGGALRRIDVETLRVETVFTTELPWETVAVAPGGGAVAFSLTDDAGTSNVWVLEIGREPVQVTSSPQGSNFPTWSPDGRYLAVEVYDSAGIHCAVIDRRSGELEQLTRASDFPSRAEECFTGGWSPDGDKILMARYPAGFAIERWNVWWVSRSTGEQRQLTARPPHPGREFVRYPSWSPAGDRVYFELAQSNADIWLFELPEP